MGTKQKEVKPGTIENPNLSTGCRCNLGTAPSCMHYLLDKSAFKSTGTVHDLFCDPIIFKNVQNAVPGNVLFYLRSISTPLIPHIRSQSRLAAASHFCNLRCQTPIDNAQALPFFRHRMLLVCAPFDHPLLQWSLQVLLPILCRWQMTSFLGAIDVLACDSEKCLSLFSAIITSPAYYLHTHIELTHMRM